MMMGRLNRDQEQFFYSFCLDQAVPDDHLVRAIATVLDLSWVHAELTSYYPGIGRPSIDPVLMIRMLIVGYVFAIRSERALCREVQVTGTIHNGETLLYRASTHDCGPCPLKSKCCPKAPERKIPRSIYEA